MAKPVLYVFAISHYCEKARWALDFLEIDHTIAYPPPGLHQRLAKKLGAARSALPILVADGQSLQGSAKIIYWADATIPHTSKCLTIESARADCLEIETQLDRQLGVHIRRYYYFEALVEHPHTVRPIFTKDLPVLRKLLAGATWNVIRARMIGGLDLGLEQGQQSKQIVASELDWLDTLLSDGRRNLAGEEFSRADIAAASLLAPLVTPKQRPVYAGLELPPRLADDVASWKDRPSLQWFRQLYADYR